ncbi:hypothetical protein [Nocardioides sp. 1609]|uniref:hypothetical protein n=1 Tax=Nocardioides sp. 1609 TaxID=2508327 RepID=UPI00106FF6E3|nr:hypothetical protein [Nocardioides sp. 1609]
MPAPVADRLQGGRPVGWVRGLDDVPLWAKVVAVYLGLRLVTWLLMAQAAEQQEWFPGVTGPREGEIDLALSWDAQWYQRIVDGGYPDTLPVGEDGRVQQNPWAFYPVFPYAIRVVSALTGGDFATVAPLLALLAGLGAAVLMARLLVETLPARSEHVALAAVAVWAACPVAPVLQMAYTESFSMLLLMAFLLLLVRERWWGAAAAALLLGLTRPIALPLVVVVVAAIWMRWRVRSERPVETPERVAILGTFVATGLSGILWTTIAALGTGRRDAYPSTMTAWRGEASINVLEPWQQTISWALEYRQSVFVLPALGIVVPVVLSLLMLVPRLAGGVDLRLRVWSAAYALYLLAVVDGHTSIFRYLLPLFPLAVLLVGGHRERPRLLGLRTTFWVVVGVVGQVGWIWWLVIFVPPSDYPP